MLELREYQELKYNISSKKKINLTLQQSELHGSETLNLVMFFNLRKRIQLTSFIKATMEIQQ